MINIFENYEIKNDTTFKIGGIVKIVAIPTTVDELISLLNSKKYEIVLGNCSNVLFSSNKINKNIILTKNIKEYSISDDIVKVSCGTKGAIISKACRDAGLSGFEFLIGFPGCFGGMIHMNASAHKQAISDTFTSATIYNLETSEIKTFTKEDMHFDYRKTALSDGKYIVLNAEFKLEKSSKEDIDKRMNENLSFRRDKQPSLSTGNAGSIFKNPQGDSSGRLLDLCNFKGEKEGGASVYEKHANFIVNENNATSADVLKLMYRMKTTVKQKFDIELYPEIKYIGDRETEEYKLWELIS